jgi:hypothetical protein
METAEKVKAFQRRKLSGSKWSSVSEALAANNMDWTPGCEQLQTPGGKLSKKYGITRSDNGEVVGEVGARYHAVSNSKAHGVIDAFVAKGGQIVECREFSGGRKSIVEAFFPEMVREVRKGDNVGISVIGCNSFDGTTKYSIKAQVWRLNCMNGAIGVGDTTTISNIRHTAKISDIMDQVDYAKDVLGSIIDKTVDVYKILANKKAERTKVREFMIDSLSIPHDGNFAGLSTRSSNLLEQILTRYQDNTSLVSELIAADNVKNQAEQQVNSMLLDSVIDNTMAKFDGAGVDLGSSGSVRDGGTWWDAFNALTEFLTHERGRTEESRTESILFGQSNRIMRHALDYAMSV